MHYIFYFNYRSRAQIHSHLKNSKVMDQLQNSLDYYCPLIPFLYQVGRYFIFYEVLFSAFFKNRTSATKFFNPPDLNIFFW